jgi:hypothetical protein
MVSRIATPVRYGSGEKPGRQKLSQYPSKDGEVTYLPSLFHHNQSGPTDRKLGPE